MAFVISKLFTYIFLPPGIFIIVLFMASFVSKKFRYLFLLSACVLYFLSITPVKDLIVKPLERIKSNHIKGEAVVVLGGGVNARDTIKCYPDAFKRLVYGLVIAKKYKISLVYSGGKIKFNESEMVKKDIKLICGLCKCGFKIYFDNRSANTYQNGLYTSELFEKLHLKKRIYLVTSAYHMKRAMLVFKHFGFKVNPKPVGFMYEGHYIVWDYFPRMGVLYKSYKAIHEYFGILGLKILHSF